LATPLPPACTFISRMRASLFPRNAVVARWLVGAGPTDDVEDEEEDVERLRGVMAAFYGRDRNGDDAEGEDDDGDGGDDEEDGDEGGQDDDNNESLVDLL
jgi:hypothetical protein